MVIVKVLYETTGEMRRITVPSPTLLENLLTTLRNLFSLSLDTPLSIKAWLYV